MLLIHQFPFRNAANVVHSRPLLSAASTDSATAVASDRSPPKHGQKRTREPEEEDERPRNRPRTENYVPVQKDAPGPWGWFLMPFQAFIRGFREGMGGSSTSS